MADTNVVLAGNNLYINGYINNYPEDNEMELLRPLLVIEPKEEDEWHTVTRNDRIDLIAYRFYSNQVADASKYWWVICDANNIYNPLDLSELVGTKILIPNILLVQLLLQ